MVAGHTHVIALNAPLWYHISIRDKYTHAYSLFFFKFSLTSKWKISMSRIVSQCLQSYTERCVARFGTIHICVDWMNYNSFNEAEMKSCCGSSDPLNLNTDVSTSLLLSSYNGAVKRLFNTIWSWTPAKEHTIWIAGCPFYYILFQPFRNRRKINAYA